MGKKGETLTAKKPPPAGPIFPKASMFLLDGAGDGGWNGFFNASGSQGGLKAYAHAKSSAKKLYSDASGRWVCVEGGEFFYFAPGGKGPRPPTGGWAVQRGAAPAPKLSWNPEAKARLEEQEQEAKAAAVAARKKEREARATAKKAGGGGSGGGAETEEQKVARLQKQWMPLVKQGEALELGGGGGGGGGGDEQQAAADLDGALALYEKAMGGFRAEGVQRPKLQAKIDATSEKIFARRMTAGAAGAGGPEPEPELGLVDQSVEVDASIEASS
jgi:hypothetical protein